MSRTPRTRLTPNAGDAFYILWCPTSDKPPTVRFVDEEGALRVANEMAASYRTTFYVLRAEAEVGPSEATRTTWLK